MEVSDVLRDRMQQPGGLNRMLSLSMAAHMLFVAAIMFAPGGLFSQSKTPSTIMTISLGGGGDGPENGGMTSIGGRKVDVERPPDEPKRREPVTRPAAKPAEMTLSTRDTKTKATPSTARQSADDARGNKLIKGDKVTPGNTPADTGTRGMGFGLTQGGGPGSGSSLDVGDFCCPEYINTMIVRVRQAWSPNQGAVGQTLVKFTIQRNGALVNAEVERSSGNPVLDTAALRAIITTRALPPLPDAFPNPALTVHLNFQYQ